MQFIKDKHEDKETGKTKAVHGNVHDCLGMSLDFSSKGTIKIDAKDHVQLMLDDFSENLGEAASMPAADHSFQVREATKLETTKAQELHNVAARGSFACERAKQDIQLAISFLCTRVKEPDKDNWGKSCQMMKCSKGTKCLRLKSSADNLNIAKWHIDASHAAHPDVKSHTGGAMMSSRVLEHEHFAACLQCMQ